MNKREEGWEDDSILYRKEWAEARFSSREEGKKTFFEKIKDRFTNVSNSVPQKTVQNDSVGGYSE